ncbi:MAG: hypothetical protein LUH36_01775 [Oscillospiraceae bacterium]|nr:hypothetical protein [Oscillospiraceae bacterium]
MSAVLIVISFVLLCVLTMKGWNLTFVGLLCAIIVGLGTSDGAFVNLTTNFLDGASATAANTFLPFVFAGVFAALMMKTRSGEVIAVKLYKIFGPKATPYIIMITTIILCMSGMSSGVVFIVTPIAFAMLKKANLPRIVGFTALQSCSAIILWCVPGIATAGNFVPAGYLGTSLSAGAGLGLFCTVFGLACSFLYVTYLTRKCRAQGIGYDPYEGEDVSADTDVLELGSNAPSIWVALAPVAVTIIISLILGQTDFSSRAIVLVAPFFGSVVCLVLNWKRIENKIEVMAKGVNDVTGLVVMCLVLGGYSYTVAATSAYESLLDILAGLDANYYVICWASVALICGLTASTSTGPILFCSTIAPTLISQGADPNIIHRLTSVTATTFDSLPHANSVVSNILFFRLKVKDAYPKVFITTVLVPLAYSLISLLVAVLFF